jgi:Protein of unknown function (DUF2934)
MNLQEEIAKTAFELYERSGCIKGRDRENWLGAEMIVLATHASQEIEEPEEMSNYEESGEDTPFVRGEGMRETGEGTPPGLTGGESEESAETAGTEELEVNLPNSTVKEIIAGVKKKVRRRKRSEEPHQTAAELSKGPPSRRKSRTYSSKAR